MPLQSTSEPAAPTPICTLAPETGQTWYPQRNTSDRQGIKVLHLTFHISQDRRVPPSFLRSLPYLEQATEPTALSTWEHQTQAPPAVPRAASQPYKVFCKTALLRAKFLPCSYLSTNRHVPGGRVEHKLFLRLA